MAKKINRFLLFILKVAVSATALWIVFRRVDIVSVVSLFKGLQVEYFFLSTLLYVFSIMVSSVRWKVLASLKQRLAISLHRMFFIYMMGAFFNTLLPGVIGGDSVRIYYLYKHTRDMSTTLGSVFLDRYTGYAGLILVGAFALVLGFQTIKNTPLVWIVPALVVTFLAGSVMVFSLQIGRRFSVLKGFYEYFLLFIRHKRMILKSLLLSIFIQVVAILSVYAIVCGLDIKIPLLSIFIYLPIIVTATAVPISISGIGIREAAFVILFGLSGIDPVSATTVSFAWFLSYVLGALPGAIIYLLWRPERP